MNNNIQLPGCRRLFLQDYEVWINIGVHDFEKTVPESWVAFMT